MLLSKTCPYGLCPSKVVMFCSPEGAPVYIRRAGSLSRYATEQVLCNGKAVGEFTVDRVSTYQKAHGWFQIPKEDLAALRMNKIDAREIAGKSDVLYGWHISDLKLYEQPLLLQSFRKPSTCPYSSDEGCTYKYHCFRVADPKSTYKACGERLYRAPKHWCYIK